MGASYSAVPGPLAHGAAAFSVELWPPAAWVGGGREGAVIAVRLTPAPPPPPQAGKGLPARRASSVTAAHHSIPPHPHPSVGTRP